MVKLKAERLKRGWRQEDLGFYARMSGADISRIERGWMKPYPGQAERLAKVLEAIRKPFLPCCRAIKQPPCGNETQGDYRAKACSA